MINTQVDDLSYMWTTERHDFLLVYVGDDEVDVLKLKRTCIFNKRDRTVTALEIDAVYEEIKRRMYNAGVPLVKLSDVMHLFRDPDPIDPMKGSDPIIVDQRGPAPLM